MGSSLKTADIMPLSHGKAKLSAREALNIAWVIMESNIWESLGLSCEESRSLAGAPRESIDSSGPTGASLPEAIPSSLPKLGSSSAGPNSSSCSMTNGSSRSASPAEASSPSSIDVWLHWSKAGGTGREVPASQSATSLFVIEPCTLQWRYNFKAQKCGLCSRGHISGVATDKKSEKLFCKTHSDRLLEKRGVPNPTSWFRIIAAPGIQA
jgi:hypothetical protein